ncbi:MAG: hypothetical protein HYX85_01070 [Chloroflexi bacterium]|nr:hypothetical protein [Chloroflexota bacterium]
MSFRGHTFELRRDLPKGKAIWWSQDEQTNMAQLKEMLDDVAYIEGTSRPGD